ncbi:MAG: serpin family protein, partial [Ignavibacteriae bacterium]|nr:serpin family protein [Ignavibacteriota bacterium]
MNLVLNYSKKNEFEGEKNIFISPLSISMALGMTLNGANGSTYDAMQSTLELSSLSNQEINEAYKSLIELLTQIDP